MALLRRLARWWSTMLLGLAILAAALGLAFVLLPYLGLAEQPQIDHVAPAANSVDIPPRSAFSIHFSTAMARRSVEEALRIDPPLAGSWDWPDDQTARWT